MNILITGASGFLGKILVPYLLARDCSVTAQVRAVLQDPVHAAAAPPAGRCFPTGEITLQTDWLPALDGTDAVVHLAQRAHVLREKQMDPMQAFRFANVEIMRNLLEQSLISGVKKFIFLSSIHAVGRLSSTPLQESDPTHPDDPYGISKLEAERYLRERLVGEKMSYTIIRPPLVIGPEPKGNLQLLIDFIKRGLPLPLGGIKNGRNYVGITNLCDLIHVCLEKREAENQIFHAADARALSTPELIRLLAAAMNRSARLVPVPESVLRFILRTLQRQKMIDSLLESLRVDASKTEKVLGWKPPHDIEYEIKRAVQ